MCSCSDTDFNPKYQMCKDRFDQWPPHEYNSSNLIRYFNYLVQAFSSSRLRDSWRESGLKFK